MLTFGEPYGQFPLPPGSGVGGLFGVGPVGVIFFMVLVFLVSLVYAYKIYEELDDRGANRFLAIAAALINPGIVLVVWFGLDFIHWDFWGQLAGFVVLIAALQLLSELIPRWW